MKLSRPDTASLALAALCVVAIAVLAVLHITVPDVLAGATYIALGIGGGTSLNSPKTDTAAARIADSLSSLEQLIGGARRSSTPAPAPAPRSPAPAPAPAVNGNGVPR